MTFTRTSSRLEQRLEIGIDNGWQQCFQLCVEEVWLALEGFDLIDAVSSGGWSKTSEMEEHKHTRLVI